AGDAQTGITIMQMDAGLDTGDMLLERAVPITESHTAARLHDELAALGGEAIVEAISLLEQGRLQRRPQPEEGVTYAAKLDKAEAALDFKRPATELARRVRASDPAPLRATSRNGAGRWSAGWPGASMPRPTKGR